MLSDWTRCDQSLPESLPACPSHPYSSEPWQGPCTSDCNRSVAALTLFGGSVTAPSAAQACSSFGRLPSNDVILDHASSSRHHASVAYDATHAAYLITDLGSAHGTRLNGSRLPATPTQLAHGDELVFGASSRTYRLHVQEVRKQPALNAPCMLAAARMCML